MRVLPVGAYRRCQGGGLVTGRHRRHRDGKPAGTDPKLGPLLAPAREIAANVGHVSDATWKAVAAAGWTDAELTKLFAHVAANMYTNCFNHYVQTEPDLPAAPGLKGWSPRS